MQKHPPLASEAQVRYLVSLGESEVKAKALTMPQAKIRISELKEKQTGKIAMCKPNLSDDAWTKKS